jgi:hypothetical protein
MTMPWSGEPLGSWPIRPPRGNLRGGTSGVAYGPGNLGGRPKVPPGRETVRRCGRAIGNEASPEPTCTRVRYRRN